MGRGGGVDKYSTVYMYTVYRTSVRVCGVECNGLSTASVTRNSVVFLIYTLLGTHCISSLAMHTHVHVQDMNMHIHTHTTYTHTHHIYTHTHTHTHTPVGKRSRAALRCRT